MTSKQQAKLINLRGVKENNDPSYRYKMEEVIISYQNLKTVFNNIVSIAKTLNRNTAHIIKFMKIYFATSFEYKLNILTTTKKISQNEFQNAIYKYIDQYVLCKKCINPETIFEINGKKTFMVCAACNHKIEI